ncbi:MAG TPA: hypothetical protein VM366_10830 [Anaerolineae bacterium]|nr:hypothetical protein [Anaerolineae bacterium]
MGNGVGLNCGAVSLALDALDRLPDTEENRRRLVVADRLAVLNAEIALGAGRVQEAEAQLAQSLRLLESGPARLEAARTPLAWGTVRRDRGGLVAAQWETSGLTHELERTRALMEHLPIAQVARPVQDGAERPESGICQLALGCRAGVLTASRRPYLENAAAHRQIVAAWEASSHP